MLNYHEITIGPSKTELEGIKLSSKMTSQEITPVTFRAMSSSLFSRHKFEIFA